jgi:tripartite-type tricarboxylate transporter receptor subunit TctC
MNRRSFIAGGAIALLSMQATALADTSLPYPQKPVRIVVGFPAGQATDIIARLVAERMQEGLGQPVIVDNKPGAGGEIALGHLGQQRADGYTVSFANTGAVVTNRYLKTKLAYDPDTIQPVALLGDIPLVLSTTANGNINSLSDFIERARANPGKLTYATPGVGTTSHLAMESLKQAAGIDVLHVPYTGSSQALTDVSSGNVDVAFDTITTVQRFSQGGRLKPLAIGTSERVAQLPDVPTLLEKGFDGIIGAVWVGAFVPRGTPEAVGERLAKEISNAVSDPALAPRLQAAGLYVRYADAAGFKALLGEDAPKIKKVVEFSGITPN